MYIDVKYGIAQKANYILKLNSHYCPRDMLRVTFSLYFLFEVETVFEMYWIFQTNMFYFYSCLRDKLLNQNITMLMLHSRSSTKRMLLIYLKLINKQVRGKWYQNNKFPVETRFLLLTDGLQVMNFQELLKVVLCLHIHMVENTFNQK